MSKCGMAIEKGKEDFAAPPVEAVIGRSVTMERFSSAKVVKKEDDDDDVYQGRLEPRPPHQKKKSGWSRLRQSSRRSAGKKVTVRGMNRVTLANEAPPGVSHETGTALEYLAKEGVNRTIAEMIKTLFEKLPSSDMQVRLVLLQWLLPRLPSASLQAVGISCTQCNMNS